ncbi:MAG: glycosyltransferase [Spirochaetia bacterium]|nr:glycosyltransferase [Spirochaetia bacterium]
MRENNNPQISVCIPIYNVENYIEKCLRSVFEQTIAEKAEFILVDDCSQDQSMAVVERITKDYPMIKNQIKIFRHENNKGSAAARNTLLKNTSGKYIIYVDADDWCEPDYLEYLYNTAEKNNADIVCCNLWEEHKCFSNRMTFKFPESSVACVHQLLIGELPSWLHIKFVKLSLFRNSAIGFIDKVDLQEDFIVSVKLFSNAQKISYIDNSLYHYNQQNIQSLSIRKTLSSDKCLQMIESVKEIERFLREKDTISFYEEDLKKRKILTKIVILLKVEKRNRKEYYNLYKNELKKIKNLNLKFFILRSILRFYDFRLYFIGNFFFSIIRFFKR